MRYITTKFTALALSVAALCSCSDKTEEYNLQLDYTYTNESSYIIHIYDEQTLNDDLIKAVVYNLEPGESQTVTNRADVVFSEESGASSYCIPSHLFGQTLEIFNGEEDEETQIVETLLLDSKMDSDEYSLLNRAEYSAKVVSNEHLSFTYTFTDNGLAMLFYQEE